jgi:hypothetical protein
MLQFRCVSHALQYLSDVTGKRIKIANALVEDDILPMFPIEYAKERLKASGYPSSLKLLGHGENGYAFEYGNKVVKITSDKSEYTNAKKLMSDNKPNIVKIFDAKHIKDKFDGPPEWWIEYWGHEAPRWEELQDLYIIVSEKIKQLSQSQMNKIDEMLESKVDNEITKQTKMIEESMQNFGKFYDLRADNLGIDKDGNLKLLDVGGSY